jgi:hypothetical protein
VSANRQLAFVQKVAEHGIVGGLQSTAEGGRFFSGSLSAAVPEGASLGTGNYAMFGTGGTIDAGKIVAAGVIGGTASQLGGGKFGNGALTGAFGEAFNDALHPNNKMVRTSFDKTKWTYVGQVSDASGLDSLTVDAGNTIAVETSSLAGPLPTNHFWFDISALPLNSDGTLQNYAAPVGWSNPSSYSSGFTGNPAIPNVTVFQSTTSSMQNRWTISVPYQPESHDNSMYDTVRVYVPKGMTANIIQP